MASPAFSKASEAEEVYFTRGERFIPLRPNNWKKLIHFTSKLYQSDRFADVTVDCGNKTFRLHSLVLCSQSDFFREKITDDGTKRNMHLDENRDAFEHCIEYLYTGKANISEHMAEKVYNLSKKLGVEELANDCKRHMYDSLTPTKENCLDIFEISNLTGDMSLAEKVRGLIRSNFSDLCGSAGLKNCLTEALRNF